MSLLVTNIQRFCLDDGPGIRTTVFFKGCTVRCPWCCNPENLQAKLEFFYRAEKCLFESNQCNQCIKNCPNGYLVQPADILKNSQYDYCLKCMKCIMNCPTKAIGMYGQYKDIKQIIEVVKKDQEFYKRSQGGVTLSGGEPLYQQDKLVELLSYLKADAYNITIETSLFAEESIVKHVAKLVDLFLVDVKILDKVICKRIIDGDISQYFNNIDYILKNRNEIIIRFPLVELLTYNEQNLKDVEYFIKNAKIKKIEIINYHSLSKSKYLSLGKNPPSFRPLDYESLNMLKDRFSKIKGLSVNLLTL